MPEPAGSAPTNEPVAGSVTPEPVAEGPQDGQSEARIAELTKEAGSYRVQRNAALRRAHALVTTATAAPIPTRS